jgi:hypothetical protein
MSLSLTGGVATFSIKANIIIVKAVDAVTDVLGLSQVVNPVTSLVAVPMSAQLKFTFADGELDTEASIV